MYIVFHGSSLFPRFSYSPPFRLRLLDLYVLVFFSFPCPLVFLYDFDDYGDYDYDDYWTTQRIYIIRKTYFFPLLATTGAVMFPQRRRLFLEFCEQVIFKVIVAKICNGKIKGLAIHV